MLSYAEYLDYVEHCKLNKINDLLMYKDFS
jgi:hypothetical protein